jgi:signal transduction histidine kinase
MTLKRKLTILFDFIVGIILIVSFISIYLSFSKFRKEEFYDRLTKKAITVGQLLLDIDEVDSALLLKMEQNNPLSLPNEKITIYDFRNEIIFTNDFSHKINITNVLINKIRIEDRVQFAINNYEVLGLFYKGAYDRVVVIVAATDIYGLRKLKNLGLILIIVAGSSLILISIAGIFFAGRALSPISNIGKKMDHIEATRLNERLEEGNGRDEIAQLARTFNKMLERLEISFKVQKNFIANASHELRTPLTVITGQLEVVLMKARENEDYRQVITSVLDDIKNLNQISNRLLLLAQTSSEFSDISFSPVRIDDVIWQARNELLKRVKSYKIEVQFDESIDDENKLTVTGNEPLLKTAFSNLMDNGCKYSSNHLTDILFRSENDHLLLSFRDQGIGIASDELEMIFDPFYRAKNAQSFKGHGIGLSLVKRIILMHNGTITVQSQLDKGSDFIVVLPCII